METASARWRSRVLGVAVAGLAAASLVVAPGTTAQAHFLGRDSVDGCQIRWEDETIYSSERMAAHGAWQALRGDACVTLLSDDWDTVADLEWKDANRSDVTWVGLYEWEPFADDIHLNKHYMQTFGTCMRQNVAMHELGHAHGLAHSFAGQVMNESNQNLCALQSHDIADYEALWGPRNPPPRPTTTCPRCQPN